MGVKIGIMLDDERRIRTQLAEALGGARGKLERESWFYARHADHYCEQKCSHCGVLYAEFCARLADLDWEPQLAREQLKCPKALP